MLALGPMRHPYHPIACCFIYQIVPSPAFMRLCVALCISTWGARTSLTFSAGGIPAPARTSHPPGIEPWTCSGNAAG